MLSLALLILAQKPLLDRIELPPGFAISYWAKDLTNARSMALSTRAP